MNKGPSKNPYLGGTAARATHTTGGEKFDGLTPLSQTIAAINSICEEPGAADAVMGEVEEPVVILLAAIFTAVAGGRSIVLTEMARAQKIYITERTARFHDKYRRK